MKIKVMMLLVLAVILAIGFGSVSNVLAAEKTVKFRIPGCV